MFYRGCVNNRVIGTREKRTPSAKVVANRNRPSQNVINFMKLQKQKNCRSGRGTYKTVSKKTEPTPYIKQMMRDHK